jgi:hypothetical protein
MAPPKKQIDYETLKGLCQIQATGEECASILGMDYDTLNNRLKEDSEDGESGFSDYFKKNRGEGLVSLRRMQFKTAEAGNPTMQIWLGKQHLGQSEKNENVNIEAEKIKIPEFKEY